MRAFTSAIAVLGARVGGAALDRRIDRAATAARASTEALVIACGGRAWDGRIEADAIAEGLRARGVEASRVTRDRLSLTTLENLIEARRMLAARSLCGVRVEIVTCGWHLDRALRIGRKLGLEVIGAPVEDPPASIGRRVRRGVAERLAAWLDGLAIAAHAEPAS